MVYSRVARERTMKLLSRITALALLVSPAFLGARFGREGAAIRELPTRRPVTTEILLQRGSLSFAINAEALQGSTDSTGSSGVDYDLLRRSASNLGIELVRFPASSHEEAAELLRSGQVDVAILPDGFADSRGMFRTPRCPAAAPEGPSPASSTSAFTLGDSPDLAAFVRPDCDRQMARAIPLARQISRYAAVIAKYADAAGLDWRLVAALIFEESSFEEHAVSNVGARGLMQLMPGASAAVGITNISKPESNIRAGVLYLQHLGEQFPEARPHDRLALVLASYLVGPGHVFDAQRLARSLGLNPHSWRSGVAETLPLLEDARFSRSTRLGFARGRQAVVYANRILERYELYRRHLDPNPRLQASFARDRKDA